jgi:hypothetical protein
MLQIPPNLNFCRAGSYFALACRFDYTGASSGSFTIRNGATGSGTFTRAPSGSTASLLHTYTSPEAEGDSENLTLTFNSELSGTWQGIVRTGNFDHPGGIGTFQIVK